MAVTAVSTVPVEPEERDPWADERFAPLDTRTSPESFGAQITKIAEEQEQQAQPPAEAGPAEAPAPPPEEPSEPQPEIIELDNGARATIWQDKKGWHASVDPGNGAGTEVFHERTQKALLRQLVVGKLNASVKIRDLTRENKITKMQQVARPEQPVQRGPHELTADEMFQLQTDFKVDPVKAIRKWFAMEFGFTPSELVHMAQSGDQANRKLTEQEHVQLFLTEHPDYLPTNHNRDAIGAYLMSHRQPDGSPLPITRENLALAYRELLSGGLLDVRRPQVEPETEPEPSPAERPRPARSVTPAPETQPSERIVRTERRTRTPLSFGLSAREAGAVQVPQGEVGSSGEELDDLSDDQITALFSGVRRLGAQTRR